MVINKYPLGDETITLVVCYQVSNETDEQIYGYAINRGFGEEPWIALMTLVQPETGTDIVGFYKDANAAIKAILETEGVKSGRF